MSEKDNALLDRSAALVKRVWGFCNVLRDDGVGASEYLEQITFLLFLKMADELDRDMPKEWNWKKLRSKSGSELKEYYEKMLAALGKEPGMLGQMFLQAKNHINTAARLAGLIDMIGRETWSGMNTDLKGDIYEELLAKTAEDKKSGAGQYFTARALIGAIMECLRPKPGETLCDPACGTGGFFLKAYAYILEHFADSMSREQKLFLKNKTFSGNEIVATTRRLCLMNMYLHNMGELDGNVPVELKDALVSSPTELVKIVATNPPFGKKTAQTVINDDGEESKEKQTYNRQDFWCATSNKQLNFVQHIRTLLRTDGRAAVVLPDNVLFEKGAGETIRKKLMETMDLHTILRLPTGIFYAQGVKTNVLFFTRGVSDQDNTKEVWFYDLRTNMPSFGKTNPLKIEDFAQFEAAYLAKDRRKVNDERWNVFTREQIAEKGDTLDLGLIRDESVVDYEELPDPVDSGEEAVDQLEEALDLLKGVVEELKKIDGRK